MTDHRIEQDQADELRFAVWLPTDDEWQAHADAIQEIDDPEEQFDALADHCHELLIGSEVFADACELDGQVDFKPDDENLTKYVFTFSGRDAAMLFKLTWGVQ